MKKECPHCKKEIEYEKHQQFGDHITNSQRKKENIKKSNETRYNNLYDKFDLKCLYCNKEYTLELTIK